jgi:hypothetical protein
MLGDAQVAPLKASADHATETLTATMNSFGEDAHSTPEQFATVFQEMHSAIFTRWNLAHLLKDQLEHWLVRSDAELAGVNLPKRPTWEAALQTLRAFAGKLNVSEQDVTSLPGDLGESAASLLKRIQAAVLDQATRADHAALQALFDAGRTNDAIAKLAEQNRQAEEGDAGGGRRNLLSATHFGLVDTPETPEELSVVPYIATAPIPFLQRYFVIRPTNTASVAQFADASEWTLRLANLAVWTISAVFITVGGYFLFADKWIGVPVDFAAVFFWAFGIDVGADAAKTAIQGIAKR